MNILISNDDGINAMGIRELVKAMSCCGDVYVVAPHDQRSASSHALSIRGKIALKRVEMEGAKRAYECTGTPADCVKLGLDVLKREGIHIDAVYAGINMGANLATDTMYSGTVSAAAEGLMEGIPSVAVSVCSHEASHFEAACKLAKDVLPMALEAKGRMGVISINTPDIPAEDILGVKAAKLGKIIYDQWFETVEADGEKTVYRYVGEPLPPEDTDDNFDVKLIHEGYATVSAIKYDLNDYAGLEEIKEWELNI